MIILTAIRNSALAIAIGVLLFAELLHPAFHNHETCSRHEDQYLVDGTPCLVQGDLEIEHSEDFCPICSSMLLKYCANNSTSIRLCNYLNSTIGLPQSFIFVETYFIGSPRAPPALT